MCAGESDPEEGLVLVRDREALPAEDRAEALRAAVGTSSMVSAARFEDEAALHVLAWPGAS
jgi:hypothetical protein